jgi:elongation factor 1-gamma
MDKTYMVNDQITLADICVASTLLYPFKLVADKNFLKPYGNVVRWFTTCVNQAEFKAVTGQVTMCKKELTAAGQEAPKAAGGGGKQAKKAVKKEKAPAAVEDEPPAPVKKVDHPYKIMDKEFPSAFSMDAWKKTYSNAKTYDAAMANFWEVFDSKGWSLWYQTYQFQEENTRTFMSSNAVGGFQQRSDEIRKWAFGVMDVLGTEETGLEIKGLWLFRGDTVQHMKDANDDANWYDWVKLAGPGLEPTDDVKKQVADFWCSENELEGKPVADSKVFK